MNSHSQGRVRRLEVASKYMASAVIKTPTAGKTWKKLLDGSYLA